MEIDTGHSSSSPINDFANLSDVDAIQPCDVKFYGVVISVPLIYINADEQNGIDRCTPNLRVMEYAVLEDLIQTAIECMSAGRDQQIDRCNYLITRLASLNSEKQNEGDSADISYIMEFLQFAVSLGKDFDIEDDYADITNIPVSFDVIRKYENDVNTGILLSAEPHDFNQVPLYSMLRDNPAATQQARALMNDSDYNRIQYYLASFEKTLCFQPGHVYSHTTKVINLALFYLCLLNESRPIANHCSNDIKGNILGYIVDLVVRSRVIQAWQRDQGTKLLLSDMRHNYDSRAPMVQFCQLTSARERGQLFMNLLKQRPDLQKFSEQINFELYINNLNKFKLNINNSEYYLLNSQFLTCLASNMPDIDTLKNLYKSNGE